MSAEASTVVVATQSKEPLETHLDLGGDDEEEDSAADATADASADATPEVEAEAKKGLFKPVSSALLRSSLLNFCAD